MDEVALIVGATLVGAIVAAAYWLQRGRLDKKLERFSDRVAMSPESIFENHYRDSGINREEFLKLWNSIATTLRVPAERLRPTDRFDVECAPVPGHFVEDEIVELNEFFRAEYLKKGISVEGLKLQTLDDAIRLFFAPRT